MFVDEVEIGVKSGSGGNGIIAFRREKFVPRGGPAGGDGGKGGDVVLLPDGRLTTLIDFRYKRNYKAERGGDGGQNNMTGRNGSDLVLRVPVGTQVYDADAGELIADLVVEGRPHVIAKGGRGGRGNQHFATPTLQTPRIAENGEPGEERHLRLELKLLADVGLIGFPNVGKSTLIAQVSAARPKIADYPFTTLVPNLGVVRVDEERSFVMADIPGLIEGAHTGAGLGDRFLRHVERTRLLVHIIDVSGFTGRNPAEDLDAINRELRLYSPALAELPQVVAFNKIDVSGARETAETLGKVLKERGLRVFSISAERSSICFSSAWRRAISACFWAVMSRNEASSMMPPLTGRPCPRARSHISRPLLSLALTSTPSSMAWPAATAAKRLAARWRSSSSTFA